MRWLLLAIAVTLFPRRRVRPRRGGRSRQRAAAGRLPPLNRLAALAAGIASITFLGLPWGVVVGGLTAWGAWNFIPSEFSSSDERLALSRARHLPDAVTLLSALLRAGLPDVTAIAMVAQAVPQPLATELAVVARHRQLGALPAAAWASFDRDPLTAPLAQAMIRQADTGASVAPQLDRVAEDSRQDYFTRAQVAARSAAVRAVIPLAACFLPAFVLLGVVPVIVSMASRLSF